MQPTRRSILAGFLSAAALPATGLHPAGAQAPPVLEPTPGCGDDDAPTVAQTEGPYFKPEAPLRRDLAADAPTGDRITLAGFVLDTGCRPVPEALVQLWHADETGAYDNAGYRLRGCQHADDGGRWWFSTIVPARYPGRTRLLPGPDGPERIQRASCGPQSTRRGSAGGGQRGIVCFSCRSAAMLVARCSVPSRQISRGKPITATSVHGPDRPQQHADGDQDDDEGNQGHDGTPCGRVRARKAYTMPGQTRRFSARQRKQVPRTGPPAAHPGRSRDRRRCRGRVSTHHADAEKGAGCRTARPGRRGSCQERRCRILTTGSE
jgi:hypothetical protein